MHVKNLSWDLEPDDLRSYFGQWGDIVDALVLRDRSTGRSRGSGFITFRRRDELNRALQHAMDGGADGAELNGRPVYVSVARPRAAQEAPKNFTYKAGLPENAGAAAASAQATADAEAALSALGLGPSIRELNATPPLGGTVSGSPSPLHASGPSSIGSPPRCRLRAQTAPLYRSHKRPPPAETSTSHHR